MADPFVPRSCQITDSLAVANKNGVLASCIHPTDVASSELTGYCDPRIVADPVPRLPPLFLGFYGLPNQIWIPPTSKSTPTSESDISEGAVFCPGIENHNCIDGQSSINIADHRGYVSLTFRETTQKAFQADMSLLLAVVVARTLA